MAHELDYIPEPIYRQARDMASETQRLLNGYIDYLKREKPGKIEPGHDVNVDQPRPGPDDYVIPD